MRDAFSNQLVELVNSNPATYLLSGDHGYALFDRLRKEKPEHFINAGVAEQNMVGVGAGLSKLGLYPVMYGLSAFVPIRVLEQIKVDFCYENLPGLFIGDGAGVVYSHLGASHQSTEDIAALRGLPHISILSPCDAVEFKACFNWATQQKSPVYIRMGKSDLGQVHQSELASLPMSAINVIEQKSSNAIFATGSMVKVCFDLIQKGLVKADLFSVPVIKARLPIDFQKDLIRYSKVVTVEEHSMNGGLGDLISSIAAEIGSIRVKKIGIGDQFSAECGTYQHLMAGHGLDSKSVSEKIAKFLAAAQII